MTIPKKPKTKTKSKSKAGRKRIDIDWEKVNRLLEAGCTGIEVAASIGMHDDTFFRRVQQEFNINFTDYAAKMRAKGDTLLRARQFKSALDGSIPMQIWLGKQRLGQRDKTDVTTNNEAINNKSDVVCTVLFKDFKKEE